MFGIHDFSIFLLSGILLNLTPGPDTFYILGRGIAQGRGAAIASALGITVGSLIHTFCAALGLSAIIATSSMAFTVVKLTGAGYLIYLSSQMLFRRVSAGAISTQFRSSSFSTIFYQGLLTNVLNPKVALFFLAFMPQFIRADSPSKFAAFVTFGLCFVVTGMIWCVCLAWFSSLFSYYLQDDNTYISFVNRVVGALFIFLGIRLAATK